ncbi:AzlD domain-containing protein [Tropicimonas sp. IMCC6043]|uniref:AzlD domain-containing protein n=1 Tax=Tropicimonas sp. IMCC6043 TaxID=2510645 RepID=UPI00101E1A6D|nr:AzlD domain-containing protein [Tropicimonas sp. IMCC6043]RYH10571.1 AzlD domain-containing protein [Tropicimonas sp. IMCC6043]
MIPETLNLWPIILVLGLGTFLIRFSFLGLFADKELPGWLLRHLRYTPVAVFPALVAPLVAWPEATGGAPDPARMLAAFATLGVGYYWRNPLYGFLAGFATLYLGLALL